MIIAINVKKMVHLQNRGFDYPNILQTRYEEEKFSRSIVDTASVAYGTTPRFE